MTRLALRDQNSTQGIRGRSMFNPFPLAFKTLSYDTKDNSTNSENSNNKNWEDSDAHKHDGQY